MAPGKLPSTNSGPKRHVVFYLGSIMEAECFILKKQACFLYQDKATSVGGSWISHQVSWISHPTQEEQEAVWKRVGVMRR